MMLEKLSHDLNGVPEIDIDQSILSDKNVDISIDVDVSDRIPSIIFYCNNNNIVIDKIDFDGFVNRFFDGIREHKKYIILIEDESITTELNDDVVNDLMKKRTKCRNNHPKF